MFNGDILILNSKSKETKKEECQLIKFSVTHNREKIELRAKSNIFILKILQVVCNIFKIDSSKFRLLGPEGGYLSLFATLKDNEIQEGDVLETIIHIVGD